MGQSKVTITMPEASHVSLDWPALKRSDVITPEIFSATECRAKEIFGKAGADVFHGSVSSADGGEVRTVVSFPGQYQDDWQCLVRRSVKRCAFEMDAAYQPHYRCTHYSAGSTACVFLPKGSQFFGGHQPRNGVSGTCWCEAGMRVVEIGARIQYFAQLVHWFVKGWATSYRPQEKWS